MTKTEVRDEIANDLDIDKKTVQAVLDGFCNIVLAEVEQGGKVPLQPLGTFKSQHRPARQGRNPATGETIQIKAKTVAKFTPAKTFKEAVA